MTRFTKIKPEWTGFPVFVIASGPSLTDMDVDLIRQMRVLDLCRVIVVNDNYLKAPWADWLHFCDYKWFTWHEMRAPFKKFKGVKSTLSPDSPCGDAIRLRQGNPSGLSTAPDTVCTGGNSGYQAINIAYLMGAREIFLLGFDQKPGTNGAMHWFGDHPRPTPESVFTANAKHWGELVSDLETNGASVYNCSRETSIEAIPRRKLSEVCDEVWLAHRERRNAEVLAYENSRPLPP